MISIIGAAALDDFPMPQTVLSKVLRVLVHLITKVNLPADRRDDDITKNKNLIFAINTLAEK